MKRFTFTLLSLCLTSVALSQQLSVDSIEVYRSVQVSAESVVFPAALIGVGIIGLESHTLKNLNKDTRFELREHIDRRFSIDDISQYAPFVSVYTLNVSGVKGANSFKDRTTILATAYLIMGGTVNAIKLSGNERRPDNSASNSFPSGHTATAFMGAEFLYQEYKHESVWYGVAGYAVAAGTGFFRLYNDRHWFSDIAAGAGIGILSTKIAYWLHPVIRGEKKHSKQKLNGVLIPGFNSGIPMLVLAP